MDEPYKHLRLAQRKTTSLMEANFSSMIPREILKKIRQIEIRTSRIVTATLAGFSFQPSPQFRRIPRTMKNRSHIDGIQFNRIVNAVFVKSFESHFVSVGRGEAKSFGRFQNLLESGVDFHSEFLTQAGTLRFIPRCRIFKFQTGKGRKNDRALHALRLLRRSWSSACTVSHGMPRSGCCRSSSARRSNSASCSGVGSSSNFSRRCSKTSRCSSNGSFSTCSMTWAALMAAIYSFASHAQAEFSPSRITYHASRAV